MSSASRLKLFWLSDANTAHTERWVRALAARGHEILLFSFIRPHRDVFASIPGVRLESANLPSDLVYATDGSLGKIAYMRAVPTVRALAQKFAPDVCHTHYVSSYGIVGMLAGLRPRVASIWGSDVYTTPFRSVVHRLAIHSVLRTANTVLSTSWVMREQGLRICRRDMRVVPFGIDINRFVPPATSREPGRPVVIGTVKSLEPKYGIDVLIEAFAIVRQEFGSLNPQLLIAGGGTRRAEYESLVDRLGLRDTVTFTGSIEYSKVHEVHQQLDIAVFPSVEDSESFGVSVIEAQACARPVIVSRVGGLPEVIGEGRTGLVVPPRDKVALARAIGTLLEDPQRARALGEAGRAHVCATYGLEHSTDLLEGEYRQLV